MPRIFNTMPKAKTVELTPELSAKLVEWNTIQAQYAELKAKEMALRVEIVSKGFDPTKLEGTETIDIGNGWKLKASKKQNYSLTNKNGETEALLAAIAAQRPDIATGLVSWKPDISIKTYKELVPLASLIPQVPELLAAALTIKPGAPELELIAPEAKEAKANA